MASSPCPSCAHLNVKPAYCDRCEGAGIIFPKTSHLQRTDTDRLKVLIRRIDDWEGLDDDPSQSVLVGDELLLDIKQCLESIVLGRAEVSSPARPAEPMNLRIFESEGRWFIRGLETGASGLTPAEAMNEYVRMRNSFESDQWPVLAEGAVSAAPPGLEVQDTKDV